MLLRRGLSLAAHFSSSNSEQYLKCQTKVGARIGQEDDCREACTDTLGGIAWQNMGQLPLQTLLAKASMRLFAAGSDSVPWPAETAH